MRHFRKASALTPSWEAMSLISCQRSIRCSVCQFGPKINTNLSQVVNDEMRHGVLMARAKNMSHAIDASKEAVFNLEYIARVKALREELGWTSNQMAIALGVPHDRYRKYESRSPMPVYLIESFTNLTRVDIHYLITGRPPQRIKKPEPRGIHRSLTTPH